MNEKKGRGEKEGRVDDFTSHPSTKHYEETFQIAFEPVGVCKKDQESFSRDCVKEKGMKIGPVKEKKTDHNPPKHTGRGKKKKNQVLTTLRAGESRGKSPKKMVGVGRLPLNQLKKLQKQQKNPKVKKRENFASCLFHCRQK